MNTRDFADAHGISERRVRALIRSGSLQAEKRGGIWQIDARSWRRAATRRPLSQASREALADAIHLRSIVQLAGQTRSRTAARLRTLRATDDPAALLSDWWGGKAPRITNAGTSLVARAIAGDTRGVREQLDQRPSEYLRRREDLAHSVLSERSIQGLSRAVLADRAEVGVGVIRAIEAGERTPIGATRRVLRELGIQPTALPSMDVEG